jgi:hypothetical protein
MADKDEENCFKDLYDTLNEFFWIVFIENKIWLNY